MTVCVHFQPIFSTGIFLPAHTGHMDFCKEKTLEKTPLVANTPPAAPHMANSSTVSEDLQNPSSLGK